MTSDGDEPLKGEAEAQSEETLMPWIWGAIGLVVIALFIGWTILSGPQSHIRQPAAAAPTLKPPAQHY